VILVPEAAPAVEEIRRKYDWSAHHGLGPHITVLLPFIEPTASDIALLEDLFGTQNPIAFELANIKRFEQYVYLEPQPGDPFIELTNRVLSAFPDLKPYDGKFTYDGVIPHLTVAYHEDETVLEQILRELAGCRVNAVARSVVLMECRDDWWYPINEFPLGPS